MSLISLLAALPTIGCNNQVEALPEATERTETMVLVGEDPWVIDARELLGASGEFELEVTATSGSVAIDGDLVTFTPDPERYLSRTQLHIVGTGADENRAYVRVDITSLPQQLDYITDSSLAVSFNSPAEGFGQFVFDAGDFDANGYPDVMVVAPRANLPFVDQGAVYLLKGNENGVSGPHLILEGEPGDRLGDQPRVLDVDGDGVSDLIYNTLGENGERQAVVYGGDLEALDPLPFVLEGEVDLWDVEFADFDGDGRADLLTEQRYPGTGWNIHLGTGDRTTPFSFDRDYELTCGPDEYYRQTFLLGDVDGAGGDDVVMLCDGRQTVHDGRTGDELAAIDPGTYLAPLPDMNGDGRDEMWVVPSEGEAYITLSGLESLSGGCTKGRRWKVPGANPKVIPDLDGDGVLDVMSTNHELDTEGVWLSGARSCATPATQPAPDLRVDTTMESALIQDFDQDGRPELVSVGWSEERPIFVLEMPAPAAPTDTE